MESGATTAAPATSATTTNKRKRDDENPVQDLNSYQQRSKRNSDKPEPRDISVEGIESMGAQKKEQEKTLVDPLKSWFQRTGKIVVCLKTCCNGDKELFLQKHPKFSAAKFVCANGMKHTSRQLFEG